MVAFPAPYQGATKSPGTTLPTRQIAIDATTTASQVPSTTPATTHPEPGTDQITSIEYAAPIRGSQLLAGY